MPNIDAPKKSFVQKHKTKILLVAGFAAGAIVATKIASERHKLVQETGELLATYLEETDQRAQYATWLFANN